MSSLKVLNARMASALGYVCGGAYPRFQWKYAPDLPYWRGRMGRVWVICQWTAPIMPEHEWRRVTGNDIPYPSGMYHPLAETSIDHEPSDELNQNYLWAMDQQMSRSFADHLNEIDEDTERQKIRDRYEWMAGAMADAENAGLNTAFSAGALTRVAGTRGDHVSFGGV